MSVRGILLNVALIVFCGMGCDGRQANGPSAHAPSVTTLTEPAERHYLDDPTPRDPTPSEVAISSAATDTSWWRDATETSGVEFVYHSGREGGQFTILETVGGGVGMLDFDQDGDLDLLFSGGGDISSTTPISVTGLPYALFQNDGQGTFVNASHRVKGPERPPYSHGVFVTDFNRDGFPDALITGFAGCVLLQNDHGKQLRDVTESAGLRNAAWSTAAAWADVNRDGWPDLFLISYLEWTPQVEPFCGDAKRNIRDVCPPQKYPVANQQLFLNNQDGSFARIERAVEGSGQGKGLGCVALDLNADGWIDFYVANDVVANQLYLGGETLPLRELGALSATSGSELGIPEGSMGVDAGDYDGDGRPDLWVTNFELEDNSLYHNEGDGMFRHAAVQSGLGGIGRPHVGFGTGFGDFDLDGWLDTFVINGHVLYETGRSAYLQTPFLLRNVPANNAPTNNVPTSQGRRFHDVTRQHGGPWFQGRYAGRGAAIGDLDNDGDLDLVVVRQDEPVAILMNQIQPPHWLRLDVRGTTSEPDAVGAVVTYRFEGRDLVRHLHAGGGYLSHFDPRVLLPADETSRLEVTVRWLNGKSERFDNLRRNATNLIREGAGESI